MSDAKLTENLNIIAESNLEIQLLDGDLNIIQKLDDEPNDVGGLTAQELKAKFDEAGNRIKVYLNETLIPALLAADATEAERAAAEAQRTASEVTRVDNETGRVTAEEARNAAENERIAEEEARKATEAQRAAAENERAAAEELRAAGETARNAAETARIKNEEGRESAEAIRGDAETVRALAEQERASAEQSRAAAEAERATAEETRTANETRREAAINNMTVSAVTLSPGAEATVDKDMNEEGGIKLTFGLPRGRDGTGTGDMHTTVYDPQGRATDVFAEIDKATAAIETHNTAEDAHADIREELELLKTADTMQSYRHGFQASDWTEDGTLVIPAETHGFTDPEPISCSISILRDGAYHTNAWSVLETGYAVDASGNVTLKNSGGGFAGSVLISGNRKAL